MTRAQEEMLASLEKVASIYVAAIEIALAAGAAPPGLAEALNEARMSRAAIVTARLLAVGERSDPDEE